MDFAPYQDTSPETQRTLSPPPSGRRSASFSPSPPPQRTFSPAPPQPWAPPGDLAARALPGLAAAEAGTAGRGRLEEFDTSLPLRLDYEACLAYLLLPPAGGVLLLILEHKSDYVRFHAWQSSLLFTAIFVIHLIFIWSKAMSWILFVGDIALIAFLTMRAWKDEFGYFWADPGIADTLDRCEVPFFGPLASRFLDDE